MDAFKKITTNEGFPGLYKGFVPGIWGVSHCAIKFMIYEKLKSKCHNYKKQPIDTKLGFSENLMCGGIAQFFAILITYPHQVIRVRLQDQKSLYNGALSCVKMTFNYEGFRGFYKGLKPTLIRIPAHACLLVTYERVSHFMKEL